MKRNMNWICTASKGKDYDLTAFMNLIRVARKSDFHRFIIQPCFLLEGWEITKDTNRATVFWWRILRGMAGCFKKMTAIFRWILYSNVFAAKSFLAMEELCTLPYTIGRTKMSKKHGVTACQPWFYAERNRCTIGWFKLTKTKFDK